MPCGFDGNSDIYGIGIRIGYYTQALAVWFSNFFLLREARSLRAVNNLFLFALVIAGFIYAHDARNIFAVEAFLLLQIGLCLVFVSIMEATRYSTRYLKVSPERLAIRTLVLNAALLFNIVFWWHGLDIMRQTPCTGDENQTAGTDKLPHGTYAFYVVPANLYGWMRTVMKVLSLALLTWRTIRTTMQDIWRTTHKLRMRRARAAFIQTASMTNSPKGTLTPKQNPGAGLHPSTGPTSAPETLPTRVQTPHSSHPDVEMELWSGLTNIADLPSRSLQDAQDSQNQCGNNYEPMGIANETSYPEAKTNTRSSISSAQSSKDGKLTSQNLAMKPSREAPEGPLCDPESCSPPQATWPPNPPSQSEPPIDEITFEKVLEADTYLSTLLSTIIPQSSASPPPTTLRSITSLFSSRPRSRPTERPPPYLSSLRTLFVATFTNHPRFPLRLTLSLHLTAFQQTSPLPYPHLIAHLASSRPPPPSWPLLALASDAQLSTIPLVISPRVWTLMAAETLLVLTMLVLQVELTIAWNHVRGLQRLDTVGQLIPCILGVGGLLQVLWGKGKGVVRGVDERVEAGVGAEQREEYEVALGRYIDWREERRRRSSGGEE